MHIRDTLKLISAIAISQSAGLIGSIFTAPAIPAWYSAIAKPELTPPSWIFGPIWTILFTLMGIAAFLVWRKGLKRRGVKVALVLFVLQLALNTFWSIIFFGFREPGAAFIEIIVLWFAIALTAVAFYRVLRPAAYLLIPYILWVSFAVYLNYAIWTLN